MESFMQDNQKARLIRSHSLESCLTFDTASVYATPYNMDSTDHTTYAPYYVESPSTILNLSSVDFRDDGDRKQFEHLTEPSSACSPLSRTASFLSNYSSEPLSMMNVNARLQSWRKSKPSLSHAEVTSKWETVDEEAALGSAGDGSFWEKSERSRCRDCFKSFILWLCMTVFFTAFLLAISTFMYWLICHPQAPSTTLKGVEFQKFHVLPGYDRTGVPTDVVSLQSNVRLAFYNPSKHYGTFVSPASVSFTYLPRPIARSQVPEFYQQSDSQRDVTVTANSDYVPLYGAGPSLKQAIAENRQIPLGLTISVKAHINLFGGIIRKYFMEDIQCNLLFNPNTNAVSNTYCEPPRRREGSDTSH